ncbi:hypothetical protein M0813_00680 [Anaeramoeba flamelloides]|uniref:Uncharacterized protein n=1 Tax=Anaeramoeba flamelloides TaxID=1746091 RepID=A0ABQ8XNA7_9EUKA|nr:hypothetical protein M0813_00680 [Anaeramoeba flamelloides]
MLHSNIQKNFQQEYEFGKILATLKFHSQKFQNRKPLENLFLVIQQNDLIECKTKLDSSRKETPIDSYTKEELKEFLNSKPRPNWKQRIEMIQRHNPDLTTNWEAFCGNNKGENKIILDKKLFEIFVELTKGITKEDNKSRFVKLCRNSQRGVVKMMEKRGFKNRSNYLRTQLVFIREN